MAISGLKQIDLSLEGGMAPATGATAPTGEGAFGEALARASASFMDPHKNAAAAVEQFEGGHRNIHETLLAVEKADISLKYMMNVRNKIIEAYKEIMQMGA